MSWVASRAAPFTSALTLVSGKYMQEVVPMIADMYEADFPEVANRDTIIAVLVKEKRPSARR